MEWGGAPAVAAIYSEFIAQHSPCAQQNCKPAVVSLRPGAVRVARARARSGRPDMAAAGSGVAAARPQQGCRGSLGLEEQVRRLA